MSLLTQNINAVKVFKRYIDTKGRAWFNSDNKKSYFITIRASLYSDLCIDYDIVDWKTVLVEQNDESFCLCLDLYKMFKFSATPMYKREAFLKSYNEKDDKGKQEVLNFLNVKDLEGLNKFFNNLELQHKKLEDELNKVSFHYTNYTSKSRADTYLKKVFDGTKERYLPLVCFENVGKRGSSLYRVFFLNQDRYLIQEVKDTEYLVQSLTSTVLADLIFNGSPTVGLVSVNFTLPNGRSYSLCN